MSEHIEAAKEGLLEWGFIENEIQTFESEAAMPDLETDEFRQIDALSKSEADQLTLTFLYFKGHGMVNSGCVHAVGNRFDNGINLEGFLKKCA